MKNGARPIAVKQPYLIWQPELSRFDDPVYVTLNVVLKCRPPPARRDGLGFGINGKENLRGNNNLTTSKLKMNF